jgi:glycosyltransferase involved in cell wall biosynthesis
LKKILIITYYWPPSGGSGVQRWLKFVKYLPQLGWQPHVYTPSNPSFAIADGSLHKDVPSEAVVVMQPVWEPFDAFNKLNRLLGKKPVKPSDFVSTGKKSLFKTISTWIRGNLFIPDARVFWVKPSVKLLTNYIIENGIEKIVTTGPPHSVHLIGLRLKKANPQVKWIADFRDPWTEWDLLDTLMLTSLARAKHKKLEHEVLTKADKVITIAPYHVERLQALGKRKVTLLTNGFDEDDFKGVAHIKTTKFTITHIGIVDELRDPRPVMEAIVACCVQHRDFGNEVLIEFIGNVNSSFKEYVKENPVLHSITRFVNQLPHNELLQSYGQTNLQLLVLAHTAIAPGNLPGKFFEYLASRNPILAIGPIEGDAARILNQTKAGEIFERYNQGGIQASLLSSYDNWKRDTKRGVSDVSMFTRKNLTFQLGRIIESL